MRDLSLFIEAAMAAEQGKMFWFLELQLNTILRYTDCDIDLWISTEIYEFWNFKSTAHSFTGNNLTITENSNSITIEATAVDPILIKAVSFSGGDYYKVQIRIKRIAGATWDGKLLYSTSGHGSSASYYKAFSQPSDFSEYQIITLDMSDLTAGGDDWINNTITELRFDFGTGVDDDFEIDYIYVVKNINKFETMPFDISTINYSAKSSVDKVMINIQNVDLQMSAVFLNENIMNKWGILWIGFFDSNNVIIDQPIELFRGLVSTWKLSELKASITLVNEFIFWNKKTLRKHQSSCRWAFKGTECGYSGAETWCDQGYARCTALSNTDNFGGDRWLPDLMEKEIYWGRTTNK